MKLAALADVSKALAATRSRSAKIQLLGSCLRALDANEREIGAAWLAGLLHGGRLGLGPAAIHNLHGLPAAAASTLTLTGTQGHLDSLKDISGKGSTARRQAALEELFQLATDAEQDFLARLLLGELRQGALEGLMADAIAYAAKLPAADVRRAIMLAGAVPPVAAAALGGEPDALSRFHLKLFEPLSPMLASPADDVDAALAALGSAVFEYKLDGARVQIHKRGDQVKIYSRSGRDVSFSLPEIVRLVGALPATTLILDGEVLAMDADGRPRAFQDSMRRFGRKLDVDDMQAQIPMSLYCFDCLHADGTDLIDRPTAERHAIMMAQLLPPALIVPRLITDQVEAAMEFLRTALASGHEGLMAKSLQSSYEAGSRGASWLKIKLAHTLDLVVLAAEWGSGRRKGWLSNLHLGARDGDGFVMLGKTFKGLDDALLQWQTDKLLTLATGSTEDYVVHVRPELVVEIAFNELQTSSRYPGGLALRFARVLRYRDDKTAAEADSFETVRALAARQRT